MENKTSKYLKYAIGEIVLVVIGILIALSINNWNEERKDAILEKKYLESIRNELEINIKTAISRKKFYDFQIENGEFMLKCLESNCGPDYTKFVIALNHLGWQTRINYTKNVWNELYSTGNIGIIKNDSIKNNLVILYQDMNTVTDHEMQEWSKYNFGYRRLVGDVLSPKFRIEFEQNLSPIEYKGEPIILENPEDIIEKLRNLSGLNGYLVDIITCRRTASKYFMTRQLALIEKISKMINEELR
jgi:hypothetical protein